MIEAGEEVGRRLLADPLDPRDVVDRVTGEAEEIGHLVRPDAELLLDLRRGHPHPLAEVVERGPLVNQLGEVFIRGDDDHPGIGREPLPRQPLAEGGDQVVGLIDEVDEGGGPERRRHLLAGGELRLELRRRQGALSLVGGIEIVPEARRQAAVERHPKVARALVRDQLQKEARETVDRLHRPALRIAQAVRQGEVGPEDVRGGIDQVDARRRSHGRTLPCFVPLPIALSDGRIAK